MLQRRSPSIPKERCMSRRYRRPNRLTGRTRKLIIGAAALAIVGGAFAVSTGISSAGENCTGLDQALQNNLTFIAGQQANPDALSGARIANRQAVVDQIQQRRVVAGCTGNVQAQAPAAAAQNGAAAVSGESCTGLDTALQNNLTFIAGQKANPDSQSAARIANRQAVVDLIQQRRQAAGCNGNVQPPAAAQPAQPPAAQPAQPPAAQPAQPPAAQPAGDVVCKGSTVTLSGEAGAPAASSGTFPIGTTLKVTNLDNNQSITVKVASPSGSCVLLNNAAFEQVHEAGKNLIRRAVIERVG
jgi:hypothetical protein